MANLLRPLAAGKSLVMGALAGKTASIAAYSFATSSLWHSYSVLHSSAALSGFEDGLLTGAVSTGVTLLAYSRLTRKSVMDRVIDHSLQRLRGDKTCDEFSRLNGFRIGRLQQGAVRCGEYVEEDSGTGLLVVRVRTTYQVWGDTDYKQGVVFCDASLSLLTNSITYSRLSLDIVSSSSSSGAVRVDVVV